MKKLALILTALLTISLSACSQKKTDTNMKQKVLIAYFSASGTTKGAQPSNWQRWQVPTCMRSSRHSPIQMLTSTGSNIKKACEDLKATYPNINWKEGKPVNRTSKDDLKKWMERNK